LCGIERDSVSARESEVINMAEQNTIPQGQPRKRQGQGRAYFTSKSGKRFYAKDYGYKCWPIGGGKPKGKK
jgi:hypothetical protein